MGSRSNQYPGRLRQIPLFYASGLEDTEHFVQFRNVLVSKGERWLGIDFAVVNSTNPPPATLPPGVVVSTSKATAVAVVQSSQSSSRPIKTSGASTFSVSFSVATQNTTPILNNGVPAGDATVLSTASAETHRSGSRLMVGAIVGPVVACAIVVMLLTGWYCYRKRTRPGCETAAARLSSDGSFFETDKMYSSREPCFLEVSHVADRSSYEESDGRRRLAAFVGEMTARQPIAYTLRDTGVTPATIATRSPQPYYAFHSRGHDVHSDASRTSIYAESTPAASSRQGAASRPTSVTTVDTFSALRTSLPYHH
ncbi:hypothetical protein BD324DRAFT_611549 [Kockovaella imperatae]|uniref:Uncharacterized protein n=1 Tax=Kockovaella imperatae TaxID=4999 RepID=A0A1Y1URC7_9TREE|nr:hypothetical protein BD324DRAFT_611549 [Kockovaella imperatae]ORX40618.1 hypothetical protein BD324DRAFT_611549 [Kockovaella imperatae]